MPDQPFHSLFNTTTMSKNYYHVQFQLTASAVCELPFACITERDDVMENLSSELSRYTGDLSEPGDQRNPAYRSFGYYGDQRPGNLNGKVIAKFDWQRCDQLIEDYHQTFTSSLAERRVKKLRLMNSEQVRALAIEAVARDQDIGAILDDLHPDFLGSKFDGTFCGALPGSGNIGGFDPYGLFNS
jgi:hypothetical protein